MIGESLPKAVGYGHDLAAREHVAGFMYGGNGVFHAGLGLCHAMAHQPGRRQLVSPHGLANAMLLPTVMKLTGWFVANGLVRFVGTAN
ncbi:hypothetical protein ACVXG9_28970 [Escherichia coli]